MSLITHSMYNHAGNSIEVTFYQRPDKLWCAFGGFDQAEPIATFATLEAAEKHVKNCLRFEFWVEALGETGEEII